MTNIDFTDKEYKAAAMLDALLDAGIAFEDIDVFGGGKDFNLRVIIHADDPDGAIEQAVRDVAATHDASQMTNAQRMSQATDRIRNLRSMARTYADDIALLYAAVISADAAGDTASERYARIRQVMADADAPFRTRFVQALASETGIDINAIGLLNLSVRQIEQVNTFSREFANSFAILLTM